jgi:gliding motility-associated-like protein
MAMVNLAEAPDGGIVAAFSSFNGYINCSATSETGIIILRFDEYLNLIWKKEIKKEIGSPLSSYQLMGLHCSKKGHIFFSVLWHPIADEEIIFFIALQADGNLLWSKAYSYEELANIQNIRSTVTMNPITTIDDKVIFLSPFLPHSKLDNGNIIFPSGLLGFSFNRLTGEFIRCNTVFAPNRVYKNYGSNLSVFASPNIRLFPEQKDFRYAFLERIPESTGAAYKEFNLISLKIDTAFDFYSPLRIRGRLSSGYAGSSGDGGFYLGSKSSIAFFNYHYVDKGVKSFGVVDSVGNILVSKKNGDDFLADEEPVKVVLSPGEEKVKLSLADANDQGCIKQVDIPLHFQSDPGSCLGKDTSFFTVEPVAELRKEEIILTDWLSDLAEVKDIQVQLSDFILNKQEYCKIKSTCSNISLTGPSSFCTASRQTFVALKNQECLKTIKWNTDTIPDVAVVEKTDSSITLQFNNAWSGHIIAELNGCPIADSVYVRVSEGLSSFSLGNHKVLCSGDSIVLSAPLGFANYEWSTKAITSQIKAGHSGVYWVKATDQCQNTFSDTIVIKEPDKDFPPIDNKQICFNDSLIIARSPHFSDYSWQPTAGNINDALYFLKPERTTQYHVTARDEYGCLWNRDFVLTIIECPEQVWVPTGFSPNADGLNDHFGPVIKGLWQSFSFKVYDRWGQVVFSSNAPLNTWNGKYKGADVPLGVYTWVCNYQFRNGKEMMRKRTVALIR